jgi:tetratricopeptide (TPR) repeat protein
MTAKSSETYLNHPRFVTAMKHFQTGNWDTSLKEIDWLLNKFPLENELQRFRKDVSSRIEMDLYEDRDDATTSRKRLAKRAIVTIAFTLALVVGLVSFSTVYRALEERLFIAQSTLQLEITRIENATKLRDAQALLQADRPDEALSLLNEIMVNDTDVPGLQETFTQATSAADLKSRYDEAVRLYELENWTSAQFLLDEISTEYPNYRNVSTLIRNIEALSAVSDFYNETMVHFNAGEWVQAIDGYEFIRVKDPSFQSEQVLGYLFESYVNAARSVLANNEDSLESLRTAESYFRKALVLRPQNPEIKSERELARLYIDAQADFLSGQYTDVISALEVVYSKEPTYAVGAALQTLYEAYVGRGDNRLAAGEYEPALSDFQRAVILAEQDPDAILRLYEAQLKVAEAQGAQDNYEAAVLLYRSAVTLGQIKQRAQVVDLTQLALLEEAEYYASAGNFSVSYERYRSALGIVPGNYCLSFEPYQDALHLSSYTQSMKTHIVDKGEYLTLIANRYHSTVCAIVLANEIADPNTIYQGQELLVPVLQ